MKKIMIAASAIALAVTSQAAQVNWKATFDQSTSGMQLYAVNADSLVGKTLTALSYSDVTDNNFQWYVQAGNLESSLLYTKSGKATPTQTTTVGLDDTNKNVMFIIVDTKGTDSASDDMYAIVNTSAIDTSAKQYTPPASGTNLSYASTDKLTFQKFQDVPEPTSALLMLLGVAGLALKRKVA